VSPASGCPRRLEHRETQLGTRPDTVEVETRVVLPEQPDRHVVAAQCENPDRLAGLDGVGDDARNDVATEEAILLGAVPGDAAAFESVNIDVREL
jgi:hypothetical protein